MLSLTRRYSFSAAHRLWNDALGEADNQRHFGPCIRLHGHNYTLEVTIAGIPDPQTGMIMDLEAIDKIIQTQILDQVDHRCLEEDVSFLKGRLSTVENVVSSFYQELCPYFPGPVCLLRVRLYESDTNWAEVMNKEMAQDVK